MTQAEYDEELLQIVVRPKREQEPLAADLAAKCRAAGASRSKAGVMRDLRELSRQTGDIHDDGFRLAESTKTQIYADDELMFGIDGRFWTFNGRIWIPRTTQQVEADVAAVAEAMGADGEIDLLATSFDRLVGQGLRNLRNLVTQHADVLGLESPPPPVLCLLNGELDLCTMEFHEGHRAGSFLTRAIDVTWDPDADAPVFRQAVSSMMEDDPEMVRHLEELLAIVVMPEKMFAAFVLFHGDGANGKTRLLELMVRMLGPAVRCDRIEALARNQFSLGALVGKTAFIDDDLDHNSAFPIDMVKRISEPKKIGSEAKFGNPYDFWCAVTPVFLTNDFPPVRDTSFGFVRRAHVVKFNRTFYLPDQVEEQAKNLGVPPDTLPVADLDLGRKLMEEASGVLNVLIDAWQRVKERGGLSEPEKCKAARREWQEAADSVLAFVQADLVPVAGASIPMRAFRERYFTWCRENRYEPKSLRKISEALRHRGFRVTAPQGSQHLSGYRFRFDVSAEKASGKVRKLRKK